MGRGKRARAPRPAGLARRRSAPQSARQGAGGARAGRAPAGPDRRRGSRAAPATAERLALGGQVESLAAKVSDCGLRKLQLLPVLACRLQAEDKN